jgi:hypothetical protein
MADDKDEQSVIDREHLRLLEIFFYIAGGSKVLFALFPLIYVVMGAVFVGFASHMPQKPGEPSPAIVGWFMAGFGLIISAIIAGLGVAQIYAGRCIHRRHKRVVCFIIAALGCLNMPWGIAIGVFSFIVLSRQSVACLFSEDGHGQESSGA